MAGKIIGTIISMMFLTFIVFLITFYFMHSGLKESINDINYSVCETIATSGALTVDLYDYLTESIGRFGNYFVKLKLEKQIKPGVYDTFFENSDIINKRLNIGDRITIYLEDKNPSLFGRLINASLMSYKPDTLVDTNIKSVKTAVISKNAKDLAKGYDVIADIADRFGDADIAVFVSTKLNPSGKHYGMMPHPDIAADNPLYGDSPDECGPTGINHIFENGDFIREEIKHETEAIRLIKYIQQ